MLMAIINIILLVVILIVVVFHIINTHDHRKKYQNLVRDYNSFKCNQRNTQSRQDRQLQQKPSMSLIDLSEFDGLDPTIKDVYRKYFTDRIMKSITNYINRNVYDNDVDKWLKKNEKHVAALVDELVSYIEELPTTEIDTTLSLAADIPKEKEKKLDECKKKLETALKTTS